MKKKTPPAPQIALPGLDAPTERHSLFFALFPDEGTALRLADLSLQLREKHGLRGAARATNHLHLGLQHVGDYDDVPAAVVARASAAAAAIALPPFELGLARAGSLAGRPHNRPLVLMPAESIPALAALQQALGRALMRAGLGRGATTPFSPHLTLRLDDRQVPLEDVPEIRWTVQEFVLVSSLQGDSHYERLGAWPLHGPFG